MFRFTIRDVLWLTVTLLAIGVTLAVEQVAWREYQYKTTAHLRKLLREAADANLKMEHELGKLWVEKRIRESENSN